MTAPKPKSKFDFASWVGGYFYNAFRSVGAVMLLAMMAADIWLGTRFIVSFAVANQGSLDGLPPWAITFIIDWLPWLLSATISGIQYWVVTARRNGVTVKTATSPIVKAILRAATIIAILDTIMDVAGFMAVWYDDPKVGHWLVHWPLNPVTAVFGVVVGIACYKHESLLSAYLPVQFAELKAARDKAKLPGGKMVAGTWIFVIFLWLLKAAYEVVTNVCRAVAVGGALFLDIFLSAFFVHQLTLAFGDGPRVAAWSLVGGIVLSLVLSALQFREPAVVPLGKKSVKITPTFLKIVDTYLDLAGFGCYMYGVGVGWHLVGPENLTPAVILMFAIVGVLCWHAEGMASLFVDVVKAKKAGGGAAGGNAQAQAVQQRIAQQRAAGGAAPNM